jgi:hypothetical protein
VLGMTVLSQGIGLGLKTRKRLSGKFIEWKEMVAKIPVQIWMQLLKSRLMSTDLYGHRWRPRLPGQLRAHPMRSRPDGIPSGRELQWPLLVCS